MKNLILIVLIFILSSCNPTKQNDSVLNKKVEEQEKVINTLRIERDNLKDKDEVIKIDPDRRCKETLLNLKAVNDSLNSYVKDLTKLFTVHNDTSMTKEEIIQKIKNAVPGSKFSFILTK